MTEDQWPYEMGKRNKKRNEEKKRKGTVVFFYGPGKEDCYERFVLFTEG